MKIGWYHFLLAASSELFCCLYLRSVAKSRVPAERLSFKALLAQRPFPGAIWKKIEAS
jgi:hypothetical protein